MAKRVLYLVVVITSLFCALCSNAFAQQCNIIFITPNGNGAGTKASPASLAGGIALSGPGSQLWLAVGSYTLTTAINMPNNATLEGGFDPANNWQKINTQQTIINRTAANPQTNPDRLVAVSCVNVTGFTVQDVTIITANAIGNGVTTYGIYLNGCSNYNISRCNVTAGNGSNGTLGIPGLPGVNGANGGNGQNGDEDGGCCTGGGAGATGSYVGSSGGGNGGNGGSRGSSGNAPPGSAGQNGQGNGGTGGAGGQGYCGVVSFGCDAGPANWGIAGTIGIDGTNGGNGGPGTPSYGAGFFQNGTGQPGINGTNGGGGGGGGGGGSQGCLVSGFFIPNNNGSGAGGGGGGEGGQGGLGAAGGTGGGGSFGIFSWAGGANARLKDTYTYSGIPGQGGLGGAPGGVGGAGGQGGNGGGPGCDIGRGGRGGNAGRGGNGGNGGNGSLGLSLPIYEDPAGLATDQSDMRTPVEPVIKVQSTGCTFSDITFSTTSNGVIQWFFDGGALPLQAVGNSVTIQYTTLGRHTVTMVLNGVPYIYTDFVGIFTDGSVFTPNIIPSNDSVCVNGSLNFSSSYVGTNYEWHFSGGTTPLTYNGPGFQNLNGVTFTQTGRYMVTLQTTSPCCGKSKIDTTYIDVIPYSTADVFVFASATDICVGEAVNFGASPVFGGTNPQYSWFVNGGAPVATGNTYSNPALQDNDVVTVQMTSNFLCAQNNPATSLPIQIHVHQPPQVNCNFVGQYLGAPTNFTVTAVGNPGFSYNWNFGDGGISNQQNPSHNYGSTGSYTAIVTVTDTNGCKTTCSQQVNIVIAPQVNASFTGNITSVACGTGSVNFTDQSTGGVIAWAWDFGDGGTSNLQNPSHNYTTPGYFDVTLIASNGVLADTLVLPNFIFIPPPPVADFIAVDSTHCEPYIFQFVDQSLGGVTQWLWDFGDGLTSNLQNPKHTYATPGTYTVSLTVTTADGCVNNYTANNYIQYLPQPGAGFFTLDTLLCTGQKVTVTDTSQGGNKWLYYFGDNTSLDPTQNPEHIYTDPGTYTVTQIVQNSAGCSDTMTLTNLITVVPFPQPLFVFDPVKLQLPDTLVQFYNQSLYFDSLTWLLGNGDTAWVDNPVGVYPDSGTYIVNLIVTNVLGCTDTLKIPLKVIEQESFFVPNTFTPDEDYLNENFRVYGRGIVSGEMYIFNRWGEEVFTTPYVFVGWDGKDKKGNYAPEGVYSYLIRIEWFTGKRFQRRGTITLLR